MILRAVLRTKKKWFTAVWNFTNNRWSLTHYAYYNEVMAYSSVLHHVKFPLKPQMRWERKRGNSSTCFNVLFADWEVMVVSDYHFTIKEFWHNCKMQVWKCHLLLACRFSSAFLLVFLINVRSKTEWERETQSERNTISFSQLNICYTTSENPENIHSLEI